MKFIYPTVWEIKNTYFRMPSTVVLHRRLSVKLDFLTKNEAFLLMRNAKAQIYQMHSDHFKK